MTFYTKKVKWKDRKKKLDDICNRLGTEEFSIVYRYYSTKNGPVRYIGRSKSPYGRMASHQRNIGVYGFNDYLVIRVSYLDIRSFVGKNRFRESYYEECRQYHKHNKPFSNVNHPAREGSWKCPVKGCEK